MAKHEMPVTALWVHADASTAVERTYGLERDGNALRATSPAGELLLKVAAGMGVSGTAGVVVERDAQGDDAKLIWDDAADSWKALTGASTAAALSMGALSATTGTFSGGVGCTTVTASSTITATGEAILNGGIRITGTVFADASRNVTAAAITAASLSASGSVTFGTTSGSLVQGVTTRIDASGNATFAALSATTGTFSGALGGTTGTFSGAVGVASLSAAGAVACDTVSAETSIDAWDGFVNGATGLRTGTSPGTTRIDASGNATLAAVGCTTVTASSTITATGEAALNGGVRIAGTVALDTSRNATLGTVSCTAITANAAATHLFSVSATERLRVDSAGVDVTGTLDVTGAATVGGDLTIDRVGDAAQARVVLKSDAGQFSGLTFYEGSTQKVQLQKTDANNFRVYCYVAAASALDIANSSAECTFAKDAHFSMGMDVANRVVAGQLRVTTPSAPASAGATGTTGEIAWDGSYLYVCTATDTWVRAALSTW